MTPAEAFLLGALVGFVGAFLLSAAVGIVLGKMFLK